MTKEELILEAKGCLEKGYLLYLYFSSATKMYEWKPIDPKYYKGSKNTLEGFRKKCTANHKLYDNIEEMFSDRQELNRQLLVIPQDEKEQLNKTKELLRRLIDTLEVMDGEQVRELKVVKETEQFLKDIALPKE